MGSAAVAEAPLRLHGDLEVWIAEARRLPNMDLTSERMRSCFTACVAAGGDAGSRSSSTGSRKNNKKKKKRLITSASYAYVSVCLAGATVAQTRVIPNSGGPRWDERFRVEVAHAAAAIDLHVKDNHVFGARLIGVASVPAGRLVTGVLIDGWFPIIHGHHHHGSTPAAELRFSLRYTPAQLQPGSGSPLCAAVPNAYFPLRRGGRVTLYQDAHVADGQLPDIELDGGGTYRHGRCWEDISRAIADAHHIVYVVGWSIHHPVRLVREPTGAGAGTGTTTNKTLGELLKGKVHEGVRVVMLIWDDKTSHDRFLLKTPGCRTA